MITITVIGSSSAGNCYVVSNGDTRLMLECGLPWKKIKQEIGYTTSSIDGVLVTHEHQDHLKAGKDVIKAGLDLYLSKGTAEAANLTGHRVHHVTPRKQFITGTFTILPFDVEHDAAEPLGYLLASNTTKERVLFLTDTSYCKYQFKGVTHLMIECNFCDEILEHNIASGRVEPSRRHRLLRSHMSLQRVKDFIKANDMSKLQAVWLCHLSNDNSNEVKFKDQIQRLTGVPVTVC